jgi:hypothetical protein
MRCEDLFLTGQMMATEEGINATVHFERQFGTIDKWISPLVARCTSPEKLGDGGPVVITNVVEGSFRGRIFPRC